MKRLLLLVAATFLAVAVVFPPSADATPTGLLRTDSGIGGVTIGLTNIDFFPPVGPPNGSFVVAAGTTLTSAGGNPAVGSTGNFLDLNAANPFPILGFMTFPALPGLIFDLTAIGPGASNTNCASAVAIGQSCSPFLGSPFILTLTATGTAVELSLVGVARDGTLPNSNWLGDLTEQFVALSTVPPGSVVRPVDIQNFFGCTASSVGPGQCTNQAAVITSTDSGEFLATAQAQQAPEPATLLLLMASGLVGLGRVTRRRHRRK